MPAPPPPFVDPFGDLPGAGNAVAASADAAAFVDPFGELPQLLQPEQTAVVIQHLSAGPTALARIGEELLAWFKTLVSAAVYATLIVTFGFQVARVEGQSMAPTLEDQDRLIVNKLAYRLDDPHVGDIVMLYYPVEPEKSFVKRIVAGPNDTIRIVDGQVYVRSAGSGEEVALPDEFIPEEYRLIENRGPEVVPVGYYYVMGDHRNNSSDSRSWGPVPKKYIIGKVQLRWWPVTEARIF